MIISLSSFFGHDERLGCVADFAQAAVRLNFDRDAGLQRDLAASPADELAERKLVLHGLHHVAVGFPEERPFGVFAVDHTDHLLAMEDRDRELLGEGLEAARYGCDLLLPIVRRRRLR